jgi:anti-anti-sigma factor
VADYDISKENGPRACVVRLSGGIDVSVVPDLQDSLGSALDSGCANVVMDLTEVAYADSSALGLLVWLDHKLRPTGGRLVLAGANRDVARILELSGLVAVAASISTSPNTTSALEGLDLKPVPSEALWEREISASADPDTLAETREEVAGIIASLDFPDSAVFDIKVALGEALANSIRHGVPVTGEPDIRVRVAAYADRVVIEVLDNGPGFDGIHTGSEDVYAPGGLGVMFKNALMDRVEYRESPLGGTLVSMSKHRPAGGS